MHSVRFPPVLNEITFELKTTDSILFSLGSLFINLRRTSSCWVNEEEGT